ncbi:MAG: hypothetical protein ABI742_05270 [Gemmatimonadota bacterium]
MALTPHRWLLCIVIACAVIAAAYLPAADMEMSRMQSMYAWNMGRVTPRSRLALAAERSIALDEQEALRRSPGMGEFPVVLARGGLKPVVTAALDSLVRTMWRTAPRSDSSIRLRVVASPTSPYGEPVDLWTAAERPQVLLPELTDGHTCLVLLPAVRQGEYDSGNAAGWWRSSVRRYAGQAIAPCVLRAVLGTPGPGVAGWLAGRRYDLAASISWAVGGSSGFGMGATWFERVAWYQTAMPLLMQRIVGVLPEPYIYSLGSASCAGGHALRCAELIAPGHSRPHGAGVISVAAVYGSRSGGLSSEDGAFVSDLIQERGLDRFRQFWRSPLPVDSAFAQAYGQSLGGWTHDWLVRRVGGVELGAPIHPLGAVAGLLACLLVVGATAAGAGSREIS